MSMDEVEGLGGDGGKGTTFGEGAAVCVLREGTSGIVGEMLYGEGGETGASGVGMEKPGEKESRGVTQSEVQGSEVKTSTGRRDSRTQGTVGVTLYGEEGDVEGRWGGERGTAEAEGP